MYEDKSPSVELVMHLTVYILVINPTNLGFCPRDSSQEDVLLYQELGLASNGLLKTTKSPFVSFNNPSESGRPV